METFTITGKDHDECLRIAKEKYGPRAFVLNQRTVRLGGFLGFGTREGIEIVGYVPPEMPDLSPYSKSIFKPNPASVSAVLTDPVAEKAKVLSAAADRIKTDPKMQELLSEVKSLHEKLDEKMPQAAASEHGNITQLRELLEQNDFSSAYRKKIIARVRKEVSLEDLDDFFELQQLVLAWIGEDILIYDDSAPQKSPRIIVLVGPTGVGKTTTISKLAACFRFGADGGPNRRVGLVSLDNYRIAARQQLQEFAKILEFPFCTPDSDADLKRNITLLSKDVDIILIDTAGKSPRDAKQIAETKTMLDVCGSRAEAHLAISSVTKSADIVDIMRQFEPYAYRAVIVTKIDETRQIGNVLSALSESGKAVSFLTDGQETTPNTIHKASAFRMLLQLDGFEADRDRLEKKFAERKPEALA